MKKLTNGVIIFDGLVIAALLLFFVTSMAYPAAERTLPVVVTGGALFLVAVALVGEIYPSAFAGFDTNLVRMMVGGQEEDAVGEDRSEQVGGRVLEICAWMVAFFVVLFLVGFLIAIPVFAFLFLIISGKVQWQYAVGETFVLWVVIYGIFEVFLNVELFRGILFGAIVPPI